MSADRVPKNIAHLPQSKVIELLGMTADRAAGRGPARWTVWTPDGTLLCRNARPATIWRELRRHNWIA